MPTHPREWGSQHWWLLDLVYEVAVRQKHHPTSAQEEMGDPVLLADLEAANMIEIASIDGGPWWDILGLGLFFRERLQTHLGKGEKYETFTWDWDSRDPRLDPQPGDIVQVRPWQKVYTRNVIGRHDGTWATDERPYNPAGQYVSFSSPGEGHHITMTVDQWHHDAGNEIEITPEEEINFTKFDEALQISGLAAQMARRLGYHCMSCLEGEDPALESRLYEHAEKSLRRRGLIKLLEST